MPVSMCSRSFLASDWRRALGDDVLRPPHRGRGVHREDLADDEPVAEHADRGQVLLDGRDRPRVRPDVGGHVERGHGVEAEAPRLAPREKLPHGPPVRGPRPRVRDPPREELQKPRDGIRPRVDDQRRQDDDVGFPVCDDHRLHGRRHQRLAHSDTSPPPPTPPSTSASNRS